MFSLIVGVAANTRGRSPILWFLLAAVFSPLVFGLLLLAMPKREGGDKVMLTGAIAHPLPDGFDDHYQGYPFKLIGGGRIEAITPDGPKTYTSWAAFKKAIGAN